MNNLLINTGSEVSACLEFYHGTRKEELHFPAPVVAERARVHVYRFWCGSERKLRIDLLVKSRWTAEEGFIAADIDDVLNMAPKGIDSMINYNGKPMKARLYPQEQ